MFDSPRGFLFATSIQTGPPALAFFMLCSACSDPVEPVQNIGAGGGTATGATTTGGGVTMGTMGTTGVGGATGSTSTTMAAGGTATSSAGGTTTVTVPNLMGDAASTEGCERGPSIIETSCSLAGCHLDMRMPNMVGDFISELRTAGTRSGVCSRDSEFRLLIDPSNPADSYIIEKINPLPCDISDPTEQFITGFQMPLTQGTTNMSNPLSAEDIQCLTDWIMAIAPP